MAGCRWLWVTNEPVGGSDKPSERTALWSPDAMTPAVAAEGDR